MDNPAIVAAINHRVYCEIQPSENFSVELQDAGVDSRANFHQQSLEWTGSLASANAHVLIFAQKAIECTLNYLSPHSTFKLRTWSDIASKQGQKKGFGTSAAAVVAIVGAILKFHGVDISSERGKDIVFKLASIAHFQAQGNIGSGIDVAASTWGGIIMYKRFNPVWLDTQLKKSKPLRDVINSSWPKLLVERLPRPPRLRLLVGWTGSPASTVNLVKKVSEHPQRIAIYNQIGFLVKKLISAWKTNREQEILEIIQQNETLLRALGVETGISIETPELRVLTELANQVGAAGKLSGAGGGDCGIAIYFDSTITQALKNVWQAKTIQIIDVQIDERGIA